MERITIRQLFTLRETIAEELLSKYVYPWEVLPNIGEFIIRLGKTLPEDIYEKCGENIWIAKSADVAPTACINGPAIIDENAEIRHCAYIRGNAIVGKGTVVGNSCELKNVILFNEVQVPHYNYLGDSILGHKVHMGAGAVTSNIKCDKSMTTVKLDGARIQTGLIKFGAAIGDNVDVGCHSVLNPATIVGRNTNIYPLSSVRGYVKDGCIYKSQNEVTAKRK